MYQRRLTNVKIRLSNDEQMSGDILDDLEGSFITLRRNDGKVLYIQRGAITYIQEES